MGEIKNIDLKINNLNLQIQRAKWIEIKKALKLRIKIKESKNMQYLNNINKHITEIY